MHFAQILVAAIPLMAGLVSGDAIAFSEPDYKGATLLLPAFECRNLEGPLENHVGSLMIPQDWLCSLELTRDCQHAIGSYELTDKYAPNIFASPEFEPSDYKSIKCQPKLA